MEILPGLLLLLTMQSKGNSIEIATKNPVEYGIGVYDARVLLGIDFDEEGGNLKIAPISTESQALSEEILIYPNPTNGEINIFTNGTLLNQIAIFTVYNSVGLIVKDVELIFDKEPMTIKLTDLNNGVFFYKRETAKNKSSGKIVIIK